MIEWREFDCPWIETNEGWEQLSRFDPRLQDFAADLGAFLGLMPAQSRLRELNVRP